jgi:hypothetical protein
MEYVLKEIHNRGTVLRENISTRKNKNLRSKMAISIVTMVQAGSPEFDSRQGQESFSSSPHQELSHHPLIQGLFPGCRAT